MAGAPWTEHPSSSSSWSTQETSQPRSEPSLRLLRCSVDDMVGAPRTRALRLRTAEWPVYEPATATSTESATTSQTFAPTSPPSDARVQNTDPLAMPNSATCGTPSATMCVNYSARSATTSGKSARFDTLSTWAMVVVAGVLLAAGLASNAVRHNHGGSDTTRGNAHDTATAAVAAGGR